RSHAAPTDGKARTTVSKRCRPDRANRRAAGTAPSARNRGTVGGDRQRLNLPAATTMHTANSTRLAVDLGRRSYEIIIGTGLLDEPASYINAINSRRVLVITNTVVAPLYLQRLCAALDDFELDTLVLPDGEAQKTLATSSLIYDHLLQHGYGRDATIVALGGGVLGDIAGFAAATYQRGIDFVQVPTTLLAQV